MILKKVIVLSSVLQSLIFVVSSQTQGTVSFLPRTIRQCSLDQLNKTTTTEVSEIGCAYGCYRQGITCVAFTTLRLNGGSSFSCDTYRSNQLTDGSLQRPLREQMPTCGTMVQSVNVRPDYGLCASDYNLVFSGQPSSRYKYKSQQTTHTNHLTMSSSEGTKMLELSNSAEMTQAINYLNTNSLSDGIWVGCLQLPGSVESADEYYFPQTGDSLVSGLWGGIEPNGGTAENHCQLRTGGLIDIAEYNAFSSLYECILM